MKTVTRHPSVGRTPWSARDPLVAPSRPCSALSCGRACRVVVVARASAYRVVVVARASACRAGAVAHASACRVVAVAHASACRAVVVARASAYRVGTPADAWIAFFCVDTPIDARYEQTL